TSLDFQTVAYLAVGAIEGGEVRAVVSYSRPDSSILEHHSSMCRMSILSKTHYPYPDRNLHWPVRHVLYNVHQYMGSFLFVWKYPAKESWPSVYWTYRVIYIALVPDISYCRI